MAGTSLSGSRCRTRPEFGDHLEHLQRVEAEIGDEVARQRGPDRRRLTFLRTSMTPDSIREGLRQPSMKVTGYPTVIERTHWSTVEPAFDR
jgi:hypothetical protein